MPHPSPSLPLSRLPNPRAPPPRGSRSASGSGRSQVLLQSLLWARRSVPTRSRPRLLPCLSRLASQEVQGRYRADAKYQHEYHPGADDHRYLQLPASSGGVRRGVYLRRNLFYRHRLRGVGRHPRPAILAEVVPRLHDAAALRAVDRTIPSVMVRLYEGSPERSTPS